MFENNKKDILDDNENLINVHFINTDDTKISVKGKIGDSIMETAHKNSINIPGLCEGSLACSTCHVIVESDWFKKLDEASMDEEDMLDLAFGLTPTSRLSCQIFLTKELEGITVKLPKK